MSAQPATAYLVGGGTAVLEGWRATTIDVDLYLEPEADELLRAIPGLKEDLEINVEFSSPLDFLPELPGWRDRSPFVAQEGRLTVRHFDLYAQALAKLERGFDQDLADVRAMVDRGLVSPDQLRRLFDAVADELYRFPAVDGKALRAAVAELA
ncbi:MAG: hypothetical protein M3P18_02530 [Actinomycetota bacterium]|nr:hypothetical protein [Actinomycetota bacterium]